MCGANSAWKPSLPLQSCQLDCDFLIDMPGLPTNVTRKLCRIRATHRSEDQTKPGTLVRLVVR
jgi:hypothetical protein